MALEPLVGHELRTVVKELALLAVEPPRIVAGSNALQQPDGYQPAAAEVENRRLESLDHVPEIGTMRHPPMFSMPAMIKPSSRANCLVSRK